jgi:hypothetical protein
MISQSNMKTIEMKHTGSVMGSQRFMQLPVPGLVMIITRAYFNGLAALFLDQKQTIHWRGRD